MRILVLHSRYLSGSTSGENRVVDDEIKLLRTGGPRRLLVDTVGDRNGPLRTAANAIWSVDEAANVRRLIALHRPDVVHVHNLFPRLSPSVIRAAASRSVPTLVTLHNFRLMCLPATFLRDGVTCDACAGNVPWRGVFHGCYRGSRPASMVLASSLMVHRGARTFDRVGLFLAVSDFVRSAYVRHGIDSARIRVKSNFAWPQPKREGPGAGFLVLGRLSPEKGVDTAIAAVADRASLTVVGDGPERERLDAIAPPGISFVGSVEPESVPDHLSRTRAVLVPSRCYEGAPRSIIEAFAAGVPVIASRMGGMPELVQDDVNGLLVPPGDIHAWRAAVDRLLDDDVSERLGHGAYATWAERFSPTEARENSRMLTPTRARTDPVDVARHHDHTTLSGCAPDRSRIRLLVSAAQTQGMTTKAATDREDRPRLPGRARRRRVPTRCPELSRRHSRRSDATSRCSPTDRRILTSAGRPEDLRVLPLRSLLRSRTGLDLLHVFGLFLPRHAPFLRAMPPGRRRSFSRRSRTCNRSHSPANRARKRSFMAVLSPVAEAPRRRSRVLRDRAGFTESRGPRFEAHRASSRHSGIHDADVIAATDPRSPATIVFFGRNDVHQKGIDLTIRGFARFVRRTAGTRSARVS